MLILLIGILPLHNFVGHAHWQYIRWVPTPDQLSSPDVLLDLGFDAAANILLFVPWGVLMFIALYSVERPTVQTYILTILLGLTFTLGVEAWQYFLPSRVADINDVIWNTSGTVAGAILGHMRLRVRFEFE